MTYSYTQVHDPNLLYRLYLLISWSFIFFAEIQWIEHYRSHWFTENIRVEKRLTLINPSLNITCVKYRLFYHNCGFQQISVWLSFGIFAISGILIFGDIQGLFRLSQWHHLERRLTVNDSANFYSGPRFQTIATTYHFNRWASWLVRP